METIKCTLCNSENVNYIPNEIRNDTEGQYKMYRCDCCDTHFLYPRPQNEELIDYYDGKFREEVHTCNYYDEESLKKVFRRFTPEARIRFERVKNEICPTDEVLEIGCSVGYFLDVISDRAAMVYGTEWDQKAQAFVTDCIAKENIKVASNPQDFETTFDKIFMFHVLEHIENPVEFLIGLKKLLKPGGSIYIEVPNVDDIMVKTYSCDAFKNFYYKKAHLYNFNEKGLQYIFENAGYQYEIDFIQRYDISNHLVWLGQQRPKGKGAYADILGQEVNDAYVAALKKSKQTDTLFAKIWV